MPTTPAHLLNRLNDIAQNVRQTGQALALIGLGSAGAERDRMDQYSDLDFYIIARPGKRPRFIEQLDWLETAVPIGFGFQNSIHGHKIIYADGILCEYAIFEPDEMKTVAFTEGHLVWHDPDFDLSLAKPNLPPRAGHLESQTAWKLGEILTNLYVGLLRYYRGEKISAARFIQHYAVDRLLELAPRLETAQPAHADPFQPERRFEQQFPELSHLLPDFIPGYLHSPHAARAILQFLETHFAIDPFMKNAILEMCASA